MNPVVDVIIPVHRSDRTYLEAVRSATSEVQGLPTRVLLVLHDLDLDDDALREVQRWATVLRCADGIESPSGPRNTGLDYAEAPFVSFVDSDDLLGARCLKLLHVAIERTGADVALPSTRSAQGYLSTPLVLSRRARRLDIVRHDLFARSHSFGLIRRTALIKHGHRYPAGIRAGQDLVLMASLYTSLTTTMAFDAIYDLRDHPGDRVTTTRLGHGDQLAAVKHIVRSAWMAELPAALRERMAMRLASVNLAYGWRRKSALGHEPSPEGHRAMLKEILQASDAFLPYLSVRDRVSLRFDPHPSRLQRSLMQHALWGLVPSTVRGAVSRRGPVWSEVRRSVIRHRRRRLVENVA
jgi:hypothetical protein